MITLEVSLSCPILNPTLGSLSKGIFEQCTATGNETFSHFSRLGATTFVILSVFTPIETIYLKIRAHPLPKNDKRPFPVAVRRSKTRLLKIPTMNWTQTGFRTDSCIICFHEDLCCIHVHVIYTQWRVLVIVIGPSGVQFRE